MPTLQGRVGNTPELMLLPVPTRSCLPWSGDEAVCAPTQPAGLSLPFCKCSPMHNTIFQGQKMLRAWIQGQEMFYLTRQWPAKRNRAGRIASSFYRPMFGVSFVCWSWKNPPSGADNGIFSHNSPPPPSLGPLQYLDLILRYLLILFLSNEAPRVGDWKA